jgi:hypothetical protein
LQVAHLVDNPTVVVVAAVLAVIDAQYLENHQVVVDQLKHH